MNYNETGGIMKKRANGPKIRVVLHILVWAILLALPLYSVKRLQFSSDFLLIYYSYTIINGLLFYANYLLLIPKLFFRKRRISYYLSALALIVCFYFVADISNNIVIGYLEKKNPEGLERRLPPPRGMRLRVPVAGPHVMGYVSSSLLIVFLSLGVKVLERQSRIEKMQEEMEKAKLNAELAFLKNQISPHFFFNTLNNIYSLIDINAEDSQKAVLKLSKLMRYLLYESEQGDTKLSYEIDFMKNYIDLMKLRMSEKVSLAVDFPEVNDDISIPPLLFIPFIENAFKHGITTRGRSFINIGLSSTSEVLIFKCSNSIAGKGPEDRQPGIGLENVKKRLALLFPGKHDLFIDKHDDEFRVLLNIKLS
ncbi:MAG: hypothetical protein A2Y71_05460 [Bacteroidetes bacterium RBG_13_42_15]|nr:MAG: hypothetical protein A2Y71_05460 [Bacteroidetes bacterium RBG_13_42_15]